MMKRMKTITINFVILIMCDDDNVMTHDEASLISMRMCMLEVVVMEEEAEGKGDDFSVNDH